MAEDRHGTRGRIQAVALDLFAEQGYDKTSLREIAERLGVTKAALYYHFKSKEDIVRSLFDDYTRDVDELIAWGSGQPRTAATRRGLLDRYVDIVVRRADIFRFLENNQAAMRNLESAGTKELFRARMRALVDLTQEPAASLPERMRASLAFTAVHVGWLFFQDEPVSKDELRAVVYDIACDLAMAPSEAELSAP
jgi:AcrR family transcriptional regulator